MQNTDHTVLDFIDSFSSQESLFLIEAIRDGYIAIFEDSMSTTTSDMYSPVARHPSLNTTNADDGNENYLGSDQETFGGDPTDMIDKLNIFDIEKVTVHGDDGGMTEKFHATDTYKTLIPQIKGFADSHKLMQSHMNSDDTAVKILKA